MEFTKSDLSQLKSRGISQSEAQQQTENFINGFPYIYLQEAATVRKGIRVYDAKQTAEFVKLFEDNKDKYSIMKFVPASGAATRMMKDLYTFLNEYKDEQSTPLSDFPTAEQTINNIEKFAFYGELSQCMARQSLSVEDCINNKDYKTIIEFILTDKGLNYGKYPKAWILFHKSEDGKQAVTAFEQHLEEAYFYTCSANQANVHFTVTEEHLQGFEELKRKCVPVYEQKYGIKYNVDFSFQKHSTDTLAVNTDNTLFRDTDGHLLFRPSGHGALISNLNDLDADIIFIKNIDNISSQYMQSTVFHKELLAGVLIGLKQKIGSMMNKLKQRGLTKQDLVCIAQTINRHLQIPNMKNHTEFPTLTAYKHYLMDLINRPLRVCGMVRNTGEPGGGPFYTENMYGVSLQIVEKAQVNINNPKQRNIFMSATHFNPVDLVVSIKDWQGKKFDLLKYIDASTGFISEKSYQGQTIKAMERPGLWNGAMADWLTVFVEVPLETFNPVKTLNDLLKKAHQ
ncbi:MAG: DUF4301 family protein [Bacteroidales bacterium]|nr:DUF4301 family protein [Bacteroidales bacterium]